MEQTLLDIYADPASDTKPELLGKRGGAYYSEAAVALIASLAGDRGDVQVVNARNGGHAAVPARRGGHRGARRDRRAPAPRRCRSIPSSRCTGG